MPKVVNNDDSCPKVKLSYSIAAQKTINGVHNIFTGKHSSLPITINNE
jgi:hypothetical protein